MNPASCPSESPVSLGINLYELKEGETLKDFYDQESALNEQSESLAGPTENIDTSEKNISGLSAIQTITTLTGSSGSLGKLLQEAGVETTTSKHISVYLVNGSTGYAISGGP